MSYTLISHLRAGLVDFKAYKSENGNITFNLMYGDKNLAEMEQEAAKLFCSCVNDVFKREGIK